MKKKQKIIEAVEYFQSKYGRENILVKDYWEETADAIGLTDKTGNYLVYLASYSGNDELYYVALENPSDNDLPYTPVGDYNDIDLTEIEKIIIKHLQLT